MVDRQKMNECRFRILPLAIDDPLSTINIFPE